ncbi:acyltransferase [Hassallia byssoidea VB512170]|uniref:Acyltransferase n=1 Tax=Hassallia byssoidea VB512170 TaxID=1304833 RepID=A0A846HBM7_9CYAN|nr:acyltransferase [Hassalia byssoidea]NEU73970.1 acyltransferase [Hassalia byssoidea VB512170]
MTNQIQAPPNRFNWIDRTKGLAILGILIFHFFQNYPERINIVSVLDRNLAKLGYAAVDIFFLMAGFNVSYALISKLRKDGIDKIKVNWKSWLSKRLIRLYPAYLLAFVLSCLLYFFFGNFPRKSLLNFILSFLGLAGMKFQAVNPGFWFFTVILEAYIFTPILFYICQNKFPNILIFGSAIALFTKIVSFSFLLANNFFFYIFFLQTNFLGSYLFQFCLGLYWGWVYAEHKAFRKIDFIVATIIFTIGFILYAILGITKVNIVYMLGFDMLFTPFFFLMIQKLLSRLDKIDKIQRVLGFLSILGIYSYQIYLIHQPLYFVLLPKLKQSIQVNSSLKIVVSLMIVSVALTIYVILFTKLEKIVMKLIGNVMSKQN